MAHGEFGHKASDKRYRSGMDAEAVTRFVRCPIARCKVRVKTTGDSAHREALRDELAADHPYHQHLKSLAPTDKLLPLT